MIEQLGDGRIRQLRRPGQRTAFGRHAPNSAMRLVAVRMAKAGLVMADDGIIPVAEVERAVGAEPYIHGAEAAAGGFDERRQIFENEPGPVVADFDRPDRVVDVTAEDERALPGVREMRSANDLAAAHFASVSVFPDQGGRIVAMIHDQTRRSVNG